MNGDRLKAVAQIIAGAISQSSRGGAAPADDPPPADDDFDDAPASEPAGDDAPPGRPGNGRRRRPPARDALVGLTEFCDLWHAPDATAYATFPIKSHRETCPIDSRRFRQWLTGRAYEKTGGVPGKRAIEDAVRFLEARAVNDGPQRIPLKRVGELAGLWFVDLCDEQWRCVEISPAGWRVLKKHGLPFVRSDSMLALPVPEAGGMIEELRGFANVASEHDFMLIAAWALAALAPRGPYPALFLQGEQASGKSALTQALSSIIDPNVAPHSAPPREERDLFAGARNRHMLALDNVSHIDATLSDSLCRILTGAGYVARSLHTNAEQFTIWTRNPVLINSIGSVVDRGDLASRMLAVHFRPFAIGERRDEAELDAELQAHRPRILGALLDALSTALRRLPDIAIAARSRMADFEKLIEAASPAFDWAPGAFSEVLAARRRDIDAAVLENDVVAGAILEFARDIFPNKWEGTPTRLHELLGQLVSESVRRSRGWPQTPQALGNRLERAKPLLRLWGVAVGRVHSGQRFVTLAPLPNYARPQPERDDPHGPGE